MKGGDLEFFYKGYTIHYFDKKQLSIIRGHHVIVCHDISQYFDDKKLDVAYTKNVGKPLDPRYLAVKERRNEFDLGAPNLFEQAQMEVGKKGPVPFCPCGDGSCRSGRGLCR